MQIVLLAARLSLAVVLVVSAIAKLADRRAPAVLALATSQVITLGSGV